MEQATEVVTFKASPEVIAQLADWSTPVQIRIYYVDGYGWEIETRAPVRRIGDVHLSGPEGAQ